MISLTEFPKRQKDEEFMDQEQKIIKIFEIDFFLEIIQSIGLKQRIFLNEIRH